MMTELVSIPEYARRLGLNASTIHRQVASGAIPSVEGPDGRRQIDFAVAQSARRRNGNIARGHGGKPALRRSSEWKAREADGFDPAVRACLITMSAEWPLLMREAMRVLGGAEMDQARAVMALREMVLTLACIVHDEWNRGGVRDYRTILPFPAMEWPADVQVFFDKWNEDGLWASDDGGLPGGDALTWEMLAAMKDAKP